MMLWIPDLSGLGRGPKHRLIVDAIAEAISQGRLRAGDQLPPQRVLSHALGLSLGTVTRAYKSAIARGLLVGETGRGTFVGGANDRFATAVRAPSGNRLPINLMMNLPPPGPVDAYLAETLKEIGTDGDMRRLVAYNPEGQIIAHLESIATWLGRLGLNAHPQNLVLTNGAQHAILSALLALTRPGDTVLVENETYPVMHQIAHHLGLRMVGVGLDGQGLRPDQLDAACLKTGARVLYCMPTLQSPTGATMNQERREAIVALAERYGLIIIEDDVYGFLPEARPVPIAALAPERTIYVMSATKCLAPGLRLGVALAAGASCNALRDVAQASCWMPAPLISEVLHRWIRARVDVSLGTWLRREAQERLSLAAAVLGPSVFAEQKGLRLHLWLPLPDSMSESVFVRAAEARGVLVAPGSTFRIGRSGPHDAIRLALAYEGSHERLEHGLRIVAELLRSTYVLPPFVV